MSVAVEIQNKVIDYAERNNVKVVKKAFLEIRPKCPCCNYPENAKKWEELLSRYINLKKHLHHIRKKDNNKQYYFPETINQDSDLCSLRISEVKHELRSIRPCERCIDLYNPTRRANHPKHRKPLDKDWTDE